MSFYRWVLSAISLVVLKLIVDKALSIRRAFVSIKESPGRVSLWVRPSSPVAIAMGTAFPRPGMGGCCTARFSLYRQLGVTAFASVDLSTSQHIFWFADSEAIKLITSDRYTFQRDITLHKILRFCGGNVLSLEGSDWKRHRLVSMSAFNEANVAQVWSETLRVTNDWFEQLDVVDSEIQVDLLPAMTQIILLVIGAAGFGKRVSWTADPTTEPPVDCKFTFRSAFMDSAHSLVIRALTPRWFYTFSSVIKVPYLSSWALHARLAFDDLRIHMLDLIATARAEIASGERFGASGTSLLRNLVEANMNHDGSSKKLSEGEILSNIFAFLLAGHETTAHTLCFALVLLALYPRCQKKMYEEVIRVWPVDLPVTQLTINHRDYTDKLEYTLACVRETLRVFPPAIRVPRDVHADTVLPGTRFTPGSEVGPAAETGSFTMAIPAGSQVTIDIWALHMNPLYWGEDPSEFKPEHFIDTESYQWPRNAYLPFLSGARTCIGQRFALVAMISVLSSVVRRYEIRVPDDLAKMSFEEQKETLLRWTAGVALTPANARVKLCRRVQTGL